MPKKELVNLIVETFGLPERPRYSEIPKDRILDWMQTGDVEALGAIYSFVTKPEYYNRITPALTLVEYVEFIIRYFDCCLRLNPDSDWAHTRYEAGWDLASWFAKLWQDQSNYQESLKQIKDWLAILYKKGGVEIRRCIVDATLEHLFDNKRICYFFEDWKKDAELAVAYAEATEYVRRLKNMKGM